MAYHAPPRNRLGERFNQSESRLGERFNQSESRLGEKFNQSESRKGERFNQSETSIFVSTLLLQSLQEKSELEQHVP